jgi:hypothetical protein
MEKRGIFCKFVDFYEKRFCMPTEPSVLRNTSEILA